MPEESLNNVPPLYIADTVSRQTGISVALLVAASLSQSVFLSSPLAYLGIMILYAGISTVVLASQSLRIEYSRYALFALTGLWLIFFGHIITHPSESMLLRFPIFLGITFFNVFVLPNIIDLRVFLHTLSRFSAFIVLLGLPTIMGLSLGPITAWSASHSILSFPVLRSVYINSNTLAPLAAAGVFASLAEYESQNERSGIVFGSISMLGVILADSQATWLAFAAGMFLLILYKRTTIGIYTAVILAGGVLSAYVMGAVVHLIPAPEFIATLSFSGRSALWSAALDATNGHWLFGHGLIETGEFIQAELGTTGRSSYAPHSFVFRMLLTSGVVGLSLYLYLCGRAVIGSIQRTTSLSELLVVGIVTMLLVRDLFEGATLFGISVTSTLLAVSIGYTQRL